MLALHLLKRDEARRWVRLEADRKTSEERDLRIHRCRMCGRIDGTALTGSISGDRWCKSCWALQDRQELDEHAALVVDGKSVAELIAIERRKQATS